MIGSIFVENTMYHCNIRYSLGYKFIGKLDFSKWQKAAVTVLNKIEKFQWYQVIPENSKTKSSQISDPIWQKHQSFQEAPTPEIHYCNNINENFAKASRDVFSISKKNNNFPIFFEIFVKQNEDTTTNNDEFLIVEHIDHSYADGRSAELVINKINEVYLALVEDNQEKTASIIDSLEQITTIPSQEVSGTKNTVIPIPLFKRIKNIFKLISYKLKDEGKFSIPFEACKDNFNIMKEKSHELPIMHTYSIDKIIKAIQKENPKINPNAIICALLTHAFNRAAKEKGLTTSGNVSFRMMSDIMPARARLKLMGNYSAYMPVTANTNKPLIETALDILNWTNQFRNEKIDVAMYQFLEFATKKHLIGKQDDPVSFSYTFVINRKLSNHPNILKTAVFEEMIGALNSEPRNEFGAQMNNKILPAVVLNKNNNIFLTFYPLPIPNSSEILNNIATAVEAEIKYQTDLLNN